MTHPDVPPPFPVKGPFVCRDCWRDNMLFYITALLTWPFHRRACLFCGKRYDSPVLHIHREDEEQPPEDAA